MRYRLQTGHSDGDPAVLQKEMLLDLLRQAERHAYSLAHSYDIGGQPDRAYVLVALAERLRDTATDMSTLTPPIESHSVAPVLGLRSRAFSLRRLLRGTAWQGTSMAPLVPRVGDEQHSQFAPSSTTAFTVSAPS